MNKANQTKWRLRGNTWEFVSKIPCPVEACALAARQVIPELAAKSKPEQRDAVQFLQLWANAEVSFAMAAKEGITREVFIDSLTQMKDAPFLTYLEMSKHYSVQQVRA